MSTSENSFVFLEKARHAWSNLKKNAHGTHHIYVFAEHLSSKEI